MRLPVKTTLLWAFFVTAFLVTSVSAERSGPSSVALAPGMGAMLAAPVERAVASIEPKSDAHITVLEQRHPQGKRRRFSDGPRQVPRARGASLARAQALGIGDPASTRQLMWSKPSRALQEAVPGPKPRSLLWPVVGGRWGRGFGYTRKVRTDLRHNGIDIGAPEGTAVRAAAEGLVVYSDNRLDGLGNAVMILHPGGLTTLYGHNLRNTVQPGWYVKRGERIALVGETGLAWGPHVHFELRDNGRWRDPKPLIAGYKDLSLEGPLVEIREPRKTAERAPEPKASAAPLRAQRASTKSSSSASVRQAKRGS